MANFGGLPTAAIIAAVESALLQMGLFDQVNAHGPQSPVGSELTAAVWPQTIDPAAGESGLDGVAAVFLLSLRLYYPARSEPLDMVETTLSDGVDKVIDTLIGGFTLGGLIRNIDVFGVTGGQKLGAQYGFVSMEGNWYRCATITVPCVVNDPWDEVA